MSVLGDLRKEKGLTQKQLAELADVPLRSLQKYDNGEMDIARAEAATVCRIAKVLETTVEKIIEQA